MSRIYERSEWGARYQDGYGTREPSGLNVYGHHTVTGHSGANATLAQDCAAVRTVERVGQEIYKVGISYTFLIPPSGRIFRGVSINRVSAHTLNRNARGAALCFIGNYDKENLTTAQIASAAWILGYGAQMGWWTVDRFTALHRDVFATSCPGSRAVSPLRAVRASTETTSSGSSDMDLLDRSLDYVNEKATSARHQIARTHQYAHDIQSRIRSTAWADWVAGRLWGDRSAPVSAVKNGWDGIREDGYRAVTWLQYAYLWARRSRDTSVEARNAALESKAMLKAQAQALDELLQGQGKILSAVEEAETQVVKANAAEVAAELEISVKESDEDE